MKNYAILYPTAEEKRATLLWNRQHERCGRCKHGVMHGAYQGCDYIGDTGTSRPCRLEDGSGNCTAFEPKTRGRKRTCRVKDVAPVRKTLVFEGALTLAEAAGDIAPKGGGK